MTSTDPAPVVDPGAPPPETPATQPGDSPPDASLPALRDLIARAYPDAVPELIQGDSLDEMLASLPAAQAAWARVAEAAASASSAPPPDPVPAGSAVRSTQLDVSALSPLAKIRHGLASG